MFTFDKLKIVIEAIEGVTVNIFIAWQKTLCYFIFLINYHFSFTFCGNNSLLANDLLHVSIIKVAIKSILFTMQYLTMKVE